MGNNETTAIQPTLPQQESHDDFWTKHRPNSIFKISTLDTGFFEWWLIFMRPIVSLTEREIDVVASFLKHRQALTKIISEPSMVDTVLMNGDIQKEILKECNINQSNFYVVMSNLKKKRVIENGIINPKLIPDIREIDKGVYQLLILFTDVQQ